MNNIRIDNVVFCENARSEVGGKHTLLGVFASELHISAIPAVLSIAIWVSGTPLAAGPFEADFRVIDSKKNVLVKAKMGGDIGGTGKTALVIGPMPLSVNEEGNFTFEWNFGNKKWTKIGTLSIHLANPANAVTVPSSTS